MFFLYVRKEASFSPHGLPLQGVCLRHTDDCTPMCVPTGDEHPEKRRVCSKGCNQLVKVSKPKRELQQRKARQAKDSDMFNLVVCQASIEQPLHLTYPTTI